ncbi:hypothetical protein [Sandaracinus amylolyticus]|uniref:hypothetical protein n=1 Tax=Sandaracinus amylolyticus TaxID=927083 RepID=UPI001F3DDE52|nr:hypothetical protein [Sandaracinus amylolyticus]
MTTQAGARRRYDHCIRAAVVEGREPLLVRHLDIPASTRRSWIRRGAPPVIAIAPAALDASSLATRVAHLEHQIARLRAILRLLFALMNVMGAQLDTRRLPQGEAKARLLAAVTRAENVRGRRVALRSWA